MPVQSSRPLVGHLIINRAIPAMANSFVTYEERRVHGKAVYSLR